MSKHYLVRFGKLGQVARMLASETAYRRGEPVVVQTRRGIEWAEILAEVPASIGSVHGQILRAATPADHDRYQRLSREGSQPFCRESQQLLTAERLPQQVVDAELLLDGDSVVVYIVGEPTTDLGPIASRLSRAWQGRRVQFYPVSSALGDCEPTELFAVDASRGDPLGEDATSDAALANAPLDCNPASGVSLAGEPAKGELGESAASGDVAPPASPRICWKHRTKVELRQHVERLAEQLDSGARLGREQAFALELFGIYRQRRAAMFAEKGTPFDTAVSAAPRSADSPSADPLMVRIKLPAGRLTSEQWTWISDLADRWGNGTLRITARQALQIHGVLPRHVRTLVGQLRERLLTTLGALGDVTRNLMTCPAPPCSASLEGQLIRTARRLATHFLPSADSYVELLVHGGSEPLATGEDPIYGPTYLPHKIKFAITLAGHDCLDAFSNDVALAAFPRGDLLEGFNVYVGGGQAQCARHPQAFAALAQPLGFIPTEQLLLLAEQLVLFYRDHGQRHSRRTARFRYLIRQLGVEGLREQLLKSSPALQLEPVRPVELWTTEDHIGWHQRDRGWSIGLPVLAGRIADRHDARLKSALREICARWRPAVCLTARQNVLLYPIADRALADVRTILRDHGVADVADDVWPALPSMACPALPTCSLAVGEAERVLGELADLVRDGLDAEGLRNNSLEVRVAGCDSHCSRPLTAPLAFIAKGQGRYDILVGGHHRQFGTCLMQNVAKHKIGAALQPLWRDYKANGLPGESLAEFLTRYAVGANSVGQQVGQP